MGVRAPAGDRARRRWRSIAVGVAGACVLLASGGCSATTASPGAIEGGAYWLVRVGGSNGNIYSYPFGNKPAPNAHSQYLGSTLAQARANVSAAAARLGVTHVDSAVY